MLNLGCLVERIVDEVGDRPAVVTPAVTLSYADLDERADRLASVLHELGVGAGDRVAVALGNRLEHVVVLLAAFKLRAVPVNVNRRYDDADLARLIEEIRPAVVVAEADGGAGLATAAGPVPLLSPGEGWDAACAAAPRFARDPTRSAADEYLLYTSGSTGRPKGVRWRHGDLCAAALLGWRGIAPGRASLWPGRTLLASPLTHGTAQWALFASLVAGDTVLVGGAGGFDAAATLDLAARERASRLVVVGDAFVHPLADALDREPRRWALDALVVVASGGAPLSAGAGERLLRHLPGAVITDGFGSAETGGHGRRVLSPGRAHATTGFRLDADAAVLDDAGEVVGAGTGQAGRVARRGSLPLGYAGTADPLPTVVDCRGQRWILTNDLARVEPDGTVVLLGRVEQLINSGGEKVHPVEVEAAVRSHPAVREAMVVGIPHTRFGEEVAVIVTLVAGATLSLERLRRHCRPHLASYKLPRRLMVAGELPRTPVGKPDLGRARCVLAGEVEPSTST